jgi:outer membrane immunogenic protein
MKQKYQNFLMLLLMISFLLLATATAAENSTSGKVRFSSTAVSLGVGAEWGEGTLTLNDGSQHPFKMKGIKVIGVGYKKVSAVGTVYNLTKLSDFDGRYVAAEAGITVGGGVAGVTMRNENDVIINLGSTSTGLDFTLGPQGIEIELK